MKRKLLLGLTILISLGMIIISACSNEETNQSEPAKNPSKASAESFSENQSAYIAKDNTFDFKISFGVDAKNIIDTYNDTFTKDLIPGSATANLKFTDDEMDSFYGEMKKIEILKYPDIFKPQNNVIMQPHSTYDIKVQVDGMVKEIHWVDDNDSQEPKAVALRNLINHISNIIYSKDKYRKMPAAKGGYD